VTAQPVLRIFDSTDPIANLYAVFATDGRYQKRSTKREELRRALNTRSQLAPKIRDRMVTAEKIFGLDRDRSREGQNSALVEL